MWFKPRPAKFAAFREQQKQEERDHRRSLALRSNRYSQESSHGYNSEYSKFCPGQPRTMSLRTMSSGGMSSYEAEYDQKRFVMYQEPEYEQKRFDMYPQEPEYTMPPRYQRVSASEHQMMMAKSHRTLSSSHSNSPKELFQNAIVIENNEDESTFIRREEMPPIYHKRSSSVGMQSLTESSSVASSVQHNLYVYVPPLGQLGVCFEEVDSCTYIIASIHPTFSSSIDIFSLSIGDTLVAINDEPLSRLSLALSFKKNNRRFVFLQLTNIHRVLTFQSSAPRVPSGMSSLDVLWMPHQTLGIVFNYDGACPIVERTTSTHNPGMVHIRNGDKLIAINGESVVGQSYEDTCDVLASLPKPMVLQFRSIHPTTASQLLADCCLFHVVWSNKLPLGIALKKRPGSVFPVVSKHKDCVNYTATTHGFKVSRGDMLVKVNHQSIREVPYSDLLTQLREGPKPVILTFTKPLQ
ncbi:hypothetical protein THRCLA_09289 [Thraustotheca clavata]|uniref:PDZ domain-containing protein n=1 Tax=Thraustotheca clavata TaxID=74557 RepID=A0A1V9YXX7_9STRA|nr:hypothetical protein THRCLA_09289 [Thraustotheca clavata]